VRIGKTFGGCFVLGGWGEAGGRFGVHLS